MRIARLQIPVQIPTPKSQDFPTPISKDEDDKAEDDIFADGELDDSKKEVLSTQGVIWGQIIGFLPEQIDLSDALAFRIPFSYLSTDGKLSANSNLKIPAERAVKTYVDTNSSLSQGANWGDISGNLPDQADLNDALEGKQDVLGFTPERALNFSTGLTRTGDTVTANLSTGSLGGQTVIGGTAAGDDLTLSSTSNATKGNIIFGNSVYDQTNNRLGIGTNAPAYLLDTVGTNGFELFMDDPGQTFKIMGDTGGGVGTALRIDLISNAYVLGDVDNLWQGTRLYIDDANKEITMPEGNVAIGSGVTSERLSVVGGNIQIDECNALYLNGGWNPSFFNLRSCAGDVTISGIGNADAKFQIRESGITFDAKFNVNLDDGNVGIGTETPNQKLVVDGGLRLDTADAQPACDATTRGTFWVVQNGAGVKDDVQVCAKDAADAYAWRTLY